MAINNYSLINKNKNWDCGNFVNIGFMKNLKIIAIEAVVDGLPDIYTLQAKNGNKYEFIPHNGIRKIC